jgi:hypothetical protein
MLAILTPLFSALIALLPTLAPSLLQIGLWLIGAWVNNDQQKKANQQAFLTAVQDHMGDSLQSVSERANAWTQRQELMQKAKAKDEH